MGAHVVAQYLLGRPDKGELILLVGPEYGRMQQMAAEVGIEVREAHRVRDVEALKANTALTGRSLVLIASVPEVEGILDRASFGPGLSDLAYEADRVIYGGSEGVVVVHPVAQGTAMKVLGGRLCIQQHLGTVESGETIVELAVNRL